MPGFTFRGRIAALTIAALGLAGCFGADTFLMTHRVEPASLGTVHLIRRGDTTVQRALSQDICSFSLGETGTTSAGTEGTPGQRGFNVTVAMSNPPNSSQTDASCGDIDLLALYIGSRAGSLSVGETTSEGRIDITIGGVSFTTDHRDGLYEARVTSVSRDGSFKGSFSAVARSVGVSPARSILMTGSFDAGN